MSNLASLRHTINQFYHADETSTLQPLIAAATLPAEQVERVQMNASKLVEEIREQRKKKSILDAFLYEYDLSSEEGIALMCLAEAMLRIPDHETIDELIRDKIGSADWAENAGKSDSFFVNASTWALMLTGKIVAEPDKNNLTGVLRRLARRGGEPFIRAALSQAMKVLGKQFVMGQTIGEALERSKPNVEMGYRYSYDMLGEAARTIEDAEKYFISYQQAIAAVAKSCQHSSPIENPGISVKLSALYPRYEYSKHEDVMKYVVPKLLELAIQAKQGNIGLTVDAEEARVLDLSLDIIEKVFIDPALDNWEGFGLALQSYQKRAFYVIDWLATLAKQQKKRFMLRLIKGAYWDAEIKYAQVNGHSQYPVFTRKHSTDVSFIACARKILSHPEAFYPQFGSHNAYSVAVILELTKNYPGQFEFQCLHGMGHALYDLVVTENKVPCRIYAPVGGHRDLLAYLVRRLLENGANTSFVNRIADDSQPIIELVVDPVSRIAHLHSKPHPKIPLPANLYGSERKNSKGLDLSDRSMLEEVEHRYTKIATREWISGPYISGKLYKTKAKNITSPMNHSVEVGIVYEAEVKQVEQALEAADKAFFAWSHLSIADRAQCLLKAADLLEANMMDFMAIATYEAGKTLPDAIAEVREAIDFCRYYAMQAKNTLCPQIMPGPTGEFNQLSYSGRGIIACISPWNFPLAIFMGQVTAALVAGNCVIAKPAEQTPLIAFQAVKILHQAGVPEDVLHLLPGAGEVIGAALIKDLRVKGVMFTGSTETARLINQSLAARLGALVPFIAETGGLNTMIVDSSALLEQVVIDVMTSAFGSAGQRCSALRVLYIQEEIADRFITLLKGAMELLEIGHPAEITTDIGPLIDEDAQAMLEKHFAKMQKMGRLIARVPMAKGAGTFFAPCAFEISSISLLEREVFGPFLHIIRYKAQHLDKVIAEINSTGYGLTQGLHTRVNEKIEYISQRLQVGNFYVNRNMIGAVVGVQPFGGEGLSGTGPKAGGPNYLHRLVTEHVMAIDITASGGNASLLAMGEDD